MFYLIFILLLSCQENPSKVKNLPNPNNSEVPKENTDSSNLIFRNISNYTVFLKSIKNKEGCITLRKFTDGKTNKEYAIAVDVNSLKTNVFLLKELELDSICSSIPNSNYFQLLDKIKQQNYKTSGIDSTSLDGYALTMDLCPSSRKFDQDFFDFLAAKKVSPIYLCISGKWAEKHKKDLDYILSKKKEIEIVWVNHSYNHYYDPKKKLLNNFMLSENTNFDVEVLNNEKVMLRNGIVLSPFFRFPGLVCDVNICQKLINYGLIPLSSKAWLAKGEKVKKGSVILLHINGNERQGLPLFKSFFEKTTLNPVKIN
jgi:hypothetical protein